MTSPSARRRSRIAHFKTPFVVSVAGPALLGLACGGEADVTQNPPACTEEEPCRASPLAACPAELPEEGTSCDGYESGLTCDGPYCYGNAPLVRCAAAGVWEKLDLPTCNPPPPEELNEDCSAEMPVAGSDCTVPDLECRYPGCEGPISSWARCSHGQWLVQYSSGPACNPPAVVPVCPEVEPSAGAGCAYLDQSCGYGTCAGDTRPERSYRCGKGGWEREVDTCAAPLAECPAELPEVGTSCEGYESGLTCDGPYCFGNAPLVRCGAAGVWEELELPTCNPPPPELPIEDCSAEMPVAGSDCTVPEQECRYPGCEGPTSSWARCSHGQWLVQYSSGVACNPPAVVPVCPEVEPSAGAGCAYFDQRCGYGSCVGDTRSERGYRCGKAGWEHADVDCASVADAGAAP